MKLLNGCISLTAVLMLAACGGGGGSSAPATVTGEFIDDIVQGLAYSCSSGSKGTTAVHGEYTCNAGDDVTFSIGTTAIGTVAAQSGMITPYALFPHDVEAAINLARLIQSLDSDGAVDNGVIVLDTNLSALLPAEVDFTNASFETTVESALSMELIEATQAVEQMNSAIIKGGGTIPEGGHIPVADAGSNQAVNTAATVTLDGSVSTDADGGTLSYAWTITNKPAASTATLSDTTSVTPGFVADAEGVYVLSLVVNDGMLSSAADTVVITASTLNIIPVADAGADQNVNTASTVTLDGAASSDADGESLTYSWQFVVKPIGSNASLSDTAVVNPTFVADIEGMYTIALMVNDGSDSSAENTVVVTAVTDLPPIANAGADQKVYLNENVVLDASSSSDDGAIVSYEWKDGAIVLSTESSFVKSDFSVGVRTLTLTVTDDIGQSVSDSVDIMIFDDFTDILPMSPTGSKSYSSSSINGVTTTTVSSGSQMFFRVMNNLSRNFQMTKFEIIRTYNGSDTVTAFSTNISGILGDDILAAGESATLGYTLSTNEVGNYWTARYYMTDINTGETFTNSYVWNGTSFN